MIKIFEMFSGYGGASFGLKKANIPFECIGISEIDKYAIQCFNNNFPNIKNHGDCKKINPSELPDFDLLTGGFPCQDVSIAGNRDLSRGRTNLYLEILRIVREKKPKYILLENVKGLLSMEIDEIKLVHKIVRDLKNIGYGVCYKVLNSKNYGIPQNRERIWFVCKLDGWDFMEFQFPEKEKLKIFVKDILEKDVDKKYYLSEKMIKAFIERSDKNVPQPNLLQEQDSKLFSTITTKARGRYQDNFIVHSISNNNGDIQERKDGVGPTLTQAIGMGGNKVPFINEKTRDINKAIEVAQEIANKEQKPIQLDLYHLQYGEMRPLSTYIPQDLDVHRCLQSGEPKELLISPTLTTELAHSTGRQWNAERFYGLTNNIRRLTPKECFRLMGFLNDEINLQGLSDTQCYKLAGNGWDVNLVSKIFKKMFIK